MAQCVHPELNIVPYVIWLYDTVWFTLNSTSSLMSFDCMAQCVHPELNIIPYVIWLYGTVCSPWTEHCSLCHLIVWHSVIYPELNIIPYVIWLHGTVCSPWTEHHPLCHLIMNVWHNVFTMNWTSSLMSFDNECMAQCVHHELNIIPYVIWLYGTVCLSWTEHCPLCHLTEWHCVTCFMWTLSVHVFSKSDLAEKKIFWYFNLFISFFTFCLSTYSDDHFSVTFTINIDSYSYICIMLISIFFHLAVLLHVILIMCRCICVVLV